MPSATATAACDTPGLASINQSVAVCFCVSLSPPDRGHVVAMHCSRLDGGWSLTPRADVSYTGSQFFDAGNSVEIGQNDDVTLVNVALMLDSNDKWRFMLSGVNLTDELYPIAGTSSLTTASGYAEIIYARPRSWSLTATRTF